MADVCKECGKPLPEGWRHYVSPRTGKLVKSSMGRRCRECYNAIQLKRHEDYKSNLDCKTGAERKKLTPVTKVDSINNCYLYLAAHIVRATMIEYEKALKNDNGSIMSIARIKNLEYELQSPYYGFLTMFSIDFSRYCQSKRLQYNKIY